MIAARTSPTNMGMALLANLAAHDFGYISTGELLRRTERTLRTMEKLERFRGHFYNWYDTRTLLPLDPQYVSSVDSGNLAASLLTLRAGLGELKSRPVLDPRAFDGIEDTLVALASQTPRSLTPGVRQPDRVLAGRSGSGRTEVAARPCRGAESAGAALPGREGVGERAAAQHHGRAQVLGADAQPAVPQIPRRSKTAGAATRKLQHACPVCRTLTAGRATRLRSRLGIIDRLIARCDDLAAMDFELLYDRSRHLLSIGYDLGERRRDPSWYDLLASEARLTSYLLIAQGQVPQKHWFALGRLLTSHGGDLSLMSWSGSMFEYLMPLLFLPSYENTLLEQACQGRGVAPDRVRPPAARALGHLRVVLQRRRHEPGLSVPGVRRTRAGLQDRAGRRPGHRPLRDRAGADGRAPGSVPQPADARQQRLPGRLRALRGHRLHAVARAARHEPRGRALLHGPPSGDEPVGASRMRCSTGPCSAVSSPTRWFARPNCCCRSAIPKQTLTVHPRASESAELGHAPAAEAGAIHRVLPDPNTPLTRSAPAVQRQLSRHGDQRRRRLQPLARPGRHPLARGRHLRRLRHLHLPARPPHRALLVDRLSTHPAEARSLRGGLRPGARGIPQARPWHRSAHRDQRVARRRRRDPPRHAHQPVRRHPRHRGDELRRGGHGAAERRPRPSHLQQPVRADRDPARPQGHPLPAASAHARRADAVDVPPAGGAGARRPGSRRTRPTAPGSSAAGGRPANPVAFDARRRHPTLVEHRGLGARSHRGHPQHADAVSRRVGEPCRSSPAWRRPAKRPWLCSGSTATGTSWSAPSRWPGSRARRCCACSTSPRPTPRSTAAWPARSSTRTPCGAPRPASSPATSLASPGSGASASRATCPSSWCASATSTASTW